MQLTRSIVLGAGLAALTGCSQNPTVASPGDPRVAATCGLAMTEGNTCVKRGMKRTCYLYVGLLQDNSVYVYPYHLRVPRGASEADRKTTIVWRSVDPRLSFRGDDGPLQLKTHGEFEEGGPTDDSDGEPESKPSAPNYRLAFKNSIAASHAYTIAVRRGGVQQTCDPRITNDAN